MANQRPFDCTSHGLRGCPGSALPHPPNVWLASLKLRLADAAAVAEDLA